jgi:hypothetical protein
MSASALYCLDVRDLRQTRAQNPLFPGNERETHWLDRVMAMSRHS